MTPCALWIEMTIENTCTVSKNSTAIDTTMFCRLKLSHHFKYTECGDRFWPTSRSPILIKHQFIRIRWRVLGINSETPQQTTAKTTCDYCNGWCITTPFSNRFLFLFFTKQEYVQPVLIFYTISSTRVVPGSGVHGKQFRYGPIFLQTMNIVEFRWYHFFFVTLSMLFVLLLTYYGLKRLLWLELLKIISNFNWTRYFTLGPKPRIYPVKYTCIMRYDWRGVHTILLFYTNYLRLYYFFFD